MHKHIIMGVLGLALIGISAANGIITLPSSITTAFPQYATRTNAIHFNRGGNNFQGAIIRHGTQTLNTPQTVNYGSTSIVCNQRVQGIYYNNQRGARRWPLDTATHTTLNNIDPSYNNIEVRGGLFTDCGGNTNAVYGQVTHVLTGTLSGQYKLGAGLIYDFANNSYQNTGVAVSITVNNNQGSGYFYDSAGGIGQITGSVQIIPPSNNQTGSNTGGNTGGGSSGGGGGGGGGSNIQTTTNTGSVASTGNLVPPTTKLCHFDDVPYAANGPFNDTFGHRGFDYIEILRISCLNQGRGRTKGQWIYHPNANITRAEVLKTVSKILGSSFSNLSVTNETQIYNGNVPFADTPNWFNHYADYAFKNGLTEGLYTTDKDGKNYLNPDQAITRYEAIKIIMLAYNKISQSMVNISGPSVMGDVIDANNPYFNYIRQAEVLGFISGVPQSNGGYNFQGINNLTRAEFAKIIGVPFADQLFNIEEIIYQSDAYKKIVQGIFQTSNPMAFVQALYNEMRVLNETTFLRQYKVPKQLFLEVLYNTIIGPLLQ